MTSVNILLRRLAYAVGIFFFVWISVATITNTVDVGYDVKVFVKSARLMWNDHQSPYFTDNPGWSIRYPPWVVPLFVPLAWFSQSSHSQLAWAVGALIALLYTINWLRRSFIHWGALLLTLTVMFPLFAKHSISGQMILQQVALCLFLYSSLNRSPTIKTSLAQSLSFTLITAKITTALPFVIVIRQLATRRFLFSTLLLWVTLTSSLLAVVTPSTYSQVFFEWMRAAKNQIPPDLTFQNQGIPADIFRLLLKINPTLSSQLSIDQRYLIISVLGVIVAVSLGSWLIVRFRKIRLPPQELFIGLLALVPCVHPLSWYQTFLFSFPFFSSLMNEAFFTPRSDPEKNRHLQNQIASFVALIGVSLFTREGLSFLDQVPVIRSWKSFAVLLGLHLYLKLKTHPRPKEVVQSIQGNDQSIH